MLKRWLISFGTSHRVYYTAYHADQFARALHLNGTDYVLTVVNLAPSTVPSVE